MVLVWKRNVSGNVFLHNKNMLLLTVIKIVYLKELFSEFSGSQIYLELVRILKNWSLDFRGFTVPY